MTLAGPRKSDPALTMRRIFMHSSARARTTAGARALKLSRAREDLQRLERGLGSWHYPSEARVAARIAGIAKQRRFTHLPAHQDRHQPPHRQTHHDLGTMPRRDTADDRYALLTNLDADRADADILLFQQAQDLPGLYMLANGL